MDRTLQYDPRTKQQIKDAIYHHLYDPVKKQFDARIHDLIIRNCLANGYSHKSFTYKAEFYNVDNDSPPLKRNRLSIQFRALMDEYLEDLKQLNDVELPLVLGGINTVLNSSNELPDYLRVFPESVHHPLQKLIASCPCQGKALSEERVAELRIKNLQAFNLMKQRMVSNLLT